MSNIKEKMLDFLIDHLPELGLVAVAGVVGQEMG